MKQMSTLQLGRNIYEVNDATSRKLITKLRKDLDNVKNVGGKSAYEIAVENGFVGSEADWLASLKGDIIDVTATATVDNTVGTPKVVVQKKETTDGINFEFNFTGLKGAKGASGEGGGSDSGEADTRVPISLSATKTKTEYNQNEVISLDDLVVNVTYDDGTIEEVEHYTTNVAELSSFTPGLKKLVVEYFKNGVRVADTINLNVGFNDSYDKIQYAYKLTNAGAIKDSIKLLGLNYKMYKYTNFLLKFKIHFTIEQNTTTAKSHIYVGNNAIFKSKKLNTLTLNPNQVGEFDLSVNYTINYTGDNLHPENGEVPLLYMYCDGGARIVGMFEIKDASFALTSEIKAVPIGISATKTNKYFVEGEDVEVTDIVASVPFNTEITKTLDNTQLNIDTSNITDSTIGDVTIDVSYTENDTTVSQTLTLHYFGKDKTESDTFTEMTAPEWYNAWNYGTNLGNCFDSYGSSLQPDNVKGDKWIDEVEIHWGQPKTTQRNMQEIANAGFQMVRIPITWYPNSYLDENGKRRMGKFQLYRIKEVVDWALDAGLYVLINTHHDSKYVFDLGLADTNMVEDRCELARQFWTDIANKFKYYNERLAFEGFNEIDNKKNSWVPSYEAQEQMNQLNQAFVDAVRATGENNTKRILVCPFLIHRNAKMLADSFVCPTDTSDPNEEVSHYIGTAVHWYPSTTNQSIDTMMGAIEDFMTETGVPIMVNEYGLKYNGTAASHTSRLRYYPNYIVRAKQHRVKTVIWDNGYEYTIVRKYNTAGKGTSPVSQAQSDELVEAISNAYANDTAYFLPENQVHSFDSFDTLTCGTITSAGEETTKLDWTYVYTTEPMPCAMGQYVSIIVNQMSERASLKGLFISTIVWYNDKGTMVKYDTSQGGYGKKNALFKIVEPVSSFRVIFYVAMGPRMTTQDAQQEYLFDNGDSFVISVFNDEDHEARTLTDRVPNRISKFTVLEEGEVNASGVFTKEPVYKMTIFYDNDNSHLDYYSNRRLNLGKAEFIYPEITDKGEYELGIKYTYNGTTLIKEDTGITFKVGKWLTSMTATLENNSFDTTTITEEEIKAAIESNTVSTVYYTDETNEVVTNGVTFDYSQVLFNESGTFDVTVSYNDGLETVSATFQITIATDTAYYINPTYNTPKAISWLTEAVEAIHSYYAPAKQLYKQATQLGNKIDTNVGVFNIGANMYVYNGKVVYCESKSKYYVYLDLTKYANYVPYIEKFTGTTLSSTIPKTIGFSTIKLPSSTGDTDVCYKDAKNRYWWTLDNLDTEIANTPPSELSKGIISVADFTDMDVM